MTLSCFATRVSFVVFCAVASLLAQPSADLASGVRGTLAWEGTIDPSGLVVQFRDLNDRMKVFESDVDNTGHFHLPTLKNGNFEVQVLTRSGDILTRALITTPAEQSLTLRLPSLKSNSVAPGSAQTVSAAALLHEVPKEARKLVLKCRRAIDDGKMPDAVRLVAEAIEMDPRFAEAWHLQGVIAMQLQNYPAAQYAFSSGARVEPEQPVFPEYLALTYWLQKQPRAAEEYARKALALSPSRLRSHYILGLSLLAQNQATTEALDALREAEPEFPRAKELRQKLEKQLAKR
jgi:tetratricopeptide (TPR) repeat protein